MERARGRTERRGALLAGGLNGPKSQPCGADLLLKEMSTDSVTLGDGAVAVPKST